MLLLLILIFAVICAKPIRTPDSWSLNMGIDYYLQYYHDDERFVLARPAIQQAFVDGPCERFDQQFTVADVKQIGTDAFIPRLSMGYLLLDQAMTFQPRQMLVNCLKPLLAEMYNGTLLLNNLVPKQVAQNLTQEQRAAMQSIMLYLCECLLLKQQRLYNLAAEALSYVGISNVAAVIRVVSLDYLTRDTLKLLHDWIRNAFIFGVDVALAVRQTYMTSLQSNSPQLFAYLIDYLDNIAYSQVMQECVQLVDESHVEYAYIVMAAQLLANKFKKRPLIQSRSASVVIKAMHRAIKQLPEIFSEQEFIIACSKHVGIKDFSRMVVAIDRRQQRQPTVTPVDWSKIYIAVAPQLRYVMDNLRQVQVFAANLRSNQFAQFDVALKYGVLVDQLKYMDVAPGQRLQRLAEIAQQFYSTLPASYAIADEWFAKSYELTEDIYLNEAMTTVVQIFDVMHGVQPTEFIKTFNFDSGDNVEIDDDYELDFDEYSMDKLLDLGESDRDEVSLE